MNLLRENPYLAPAVPAFRVVANLEALSWAGLLVGMLFKYIIAAQAELGHDLVAVFGAVHGGLVIVYALLAIVVALRLRWSLQTAALALAATIPPFATLVFDWWAGRAGLYEIGRSSG